MIRARAARGMLLGTALAVLLGTTLAALLGTTLAVLLRTALAVLFGTTLAVLFGTTLALLALASTGCRGEDEAGAAALRVRTDATAGTCELSVALPADVLEPALLFGAELMARPWSGAGGERLAVALDPDGFAPIARLSSAPERFGLSVPLHALRAALETSGRFAQARWRTSEGDWVLGSAWHIRDATVDPREPVIGIRGARAVAAQRSAPRWLELLGAAALVLAAGSVFVRISPGRCGSLAVIALLCAWIAAWPRALQDLDDLRWRPDAELLRFFARAAEQIDALPPDVGVELDGPPNERCYASAAMPTARLAHRYLATRSAAAGAHELRRFARLGTDLAPNADEVLLASHAEWKLLAPRAAAGDR